MWLIDWPIHRERNLLVLHDYSSCLSKISNKREKTFLSRVTLATSCRFVQVVNESLVHLFLLTKIYLYCVLHVVYCRCFVSEIAERLCWERFRRWKATEQSQYNWIEIAGTSFRGWKHMGVHGCHLVTRCGVGATALPPKSHSVVCWLSLLLLLFFFKIAEKSKLFAQFFVIVCCLLTNYFSKPGFV